MVPYIYTARQLCGITLPVYRRFASKRVEMYANVNIWPLTISTRPLVLLWQTFMVDHHFCPVPGSPFLASANIDQAGLILGLRPANGRRRYIATPSLIAWVQT